MYQRAQDIGAEKAVLSSIFDEPEVINEVADILSAQDFAEPANEAIYAAMLELAHSNENISPIAVAALLRRRGDLGNVGGPEYIQQLLNPSTLYAYEVDAIGYALIVKDEAGLRRISSIGQQIQALGRPDNGHTAEEAIARSEHMVRDLANDTVTSAVVPTGEALDKLLERTTKMREMPEGTLAGVPSGFIDVDKLTNGWRPGQFIIIAGRPAMGKALALDTPIPTPLGLRTMRDLSVDDEVFTPDGIPTKIIAKSEVMNNRVCLRVHLSDGAEIVADGQHLWTVDVTYMLPRSSRHVVIRRTISTQKLSLLVGKRHIKISLPKNSVIDFEQSSTMSTTSAATVADIIVAGELLTPKRLSNTKTARLAVRHAFLDALHGQMGEVLHFTQAQHTNLVRSVVNSLGYTLVPVSDGYRIDKSIRSTRHITQVTNAVTVPVQCIQVEDPSHLYLCGDDYVATHNSTLALDVARHAAFMANKTVMFFSFEMSQDELLQRMLSAEARIDLKSIISGKLSDEELESLHDVSNSIPRNRLIFDDSPNSTMTHVRAAATRQKSHPEGLDLIVIDYLQLMTTGAPIESRQQEVSTISRNIKMLAKELGVPIIALSQLNRGPEQRAEKKPAMSDLRESGSLEQDADLVVLLHRPEYYDANDRPGQAFVDIAKHRGGPSGEVAVIPLLEYSMFANGTGKFPASEPPPEESPEEQADNIARDWTPPADGADLPEPPPPSDEEPPAAW